VHKEKLTRVPNAKAGRDLFDISIYGMDGVPIELINMKLADKVESKKKKTMKERGEHVEEEKTDKSRKNKRKREEKKYTFSASAGFYHNPDSINLTLNQSQMQAMYNYNASNNASFMANIPNQIMQIESMMGNQGQGQGGFNPNNRPQNMNPMNMGMTQGVGGNNFNMGANNLPR